MVLNARKPRILRAIEHLQRGERDEAVYLLREEVRFGPAVGDGWRSFSKLAAQIGEVALALEASKRFAATPPIRLDRLLEHCGLLAANGRSDEAAAMIAPLPDAAKQQPSVLHFLGVLAAERGAFAEAEQRYREAIARQRLSPQSWFALAMIRRFTADDVDLAEMERLQPEMARLDPSLYARFLYGLAKAWSDAGDAAKAFALYEQGAAIRRTGERFDAGGNRRFIEKLIADWTPEALERLVPSCARSSRAIFVNGLPRSGTTLMEQILTSHSEVADGGEINLIRAALLSTLDYSLAGALAYQERIAAQGDPWGKVAATYHRLLGERFGSEGLVVDKTLAQSHFMGLLLHALPDARVVWMRRDPEDVALSCFRSFFTSAIPWSWSFEDIAEFMKGEDRLFAHWTTLFPDSILVVPYEDLVREPELWINRVLDHAGLPRESRVLEFHESRRPVRTASVQQVRSPMTTSRIGQAAGFAAQMASFRCAYFDKA
jgi:tetratricopeptide (TPR) repeat protein